ncbi:MaoC family dehydratase [Streptomyces geranii]|uniref:MaoC family dehydratase n=1 Tax=Streptomyces geranii TaxID=2058923 RepID=UPI000D046D28|nr:MaoC/PaaZ C-terminal domain-containing protein [Streptomyces geranii]
MAERSPRTLDRPPALAPLLARGALLSPVKKAALNRRHPEAGWPRTRLVLPGVRIDLARLAAYERVCGFPVGDDALPLTYPHVLGFPPAMRLMTDRTFPLPLLGLVHTSVEIVRWRPLTATGRYELSVYVDELAAHRRGTEASVQTEVREGEELVWESRSTYLARHGGGGSAGVPAGGSGSPEEREVLPHVAEWRLGGDVGRRYGAVSGDRNPIHLYPVTARLFGFRRPIAHGMWTVARCVAAHGVPGAAMVRVEFRAPVLLPGVVDYAADGFGNFELRGGGRVHLLGEVRAV